MLFLIQHSGISTLGIFPLPLQTHALPFSTLLHVHQTDLSRLLMGYLDLRLLVGFGQWEIQGYSLKDLCLAVSLQQRLSACQIRHLHIIFSFKVLVISISHTSGLEMGIILLLLAPGILYYPLFLPESLPTMLQIVPSIIAMQIAKFVYAICFWLGP